MDSYLCCHHVWENVLSMHVQGAFTGFWCLHKAASHCFKAGRTFVELYIHQGRQELDPMLGQLLSAPKLPKTALPSVKTDCA